MMKNHRGISEQMNLGEHLGLGYDKMVGLEGLD